MKILQIQATGLRPPKEADAALSLWAGLACSGERARRNDVASFLRDQLPVAMKTGRAGLIAWAAMARSASSTPENVRVENQADGLRLRWNDTRSNQALDLIVAV
jgi:hypothetical protein